MSIKANWDKFNERQQSLRKIFGEESIQNKFQVQKETQTRLNDFIPKPKIDEELFLGISVDNIDFSLVVVNERLTKYIQERFGNHEKRRLLKKYHAWLQKQRDQDRRNKINIEKRISYFKNKRIKDID